MTVSHRGLINRRVQAAELGLRNVQLSHGNGVRLTVHNAAGMHQDRCPRPRVRGTAAASWGTEAFFFSGQNGRRQMHEPFSISAVLSLLAEPDRWHCARLISDKPPRSNGNQVKIGPSSTPQGEPNSTIIGRQEYHTSGEFSRIAKTCRTALPTLHRGCNADCRRGCEG